MNHKRDFDTHVAFLFQDPQPTDAKLRMYLLWKTLLPSHFPSLLPSSARLYTY